MSVLQHSHMLVSVLLRWAAVFTLTHTWRTQTQLRKPLIRQRLKCVCVCVMDAPMLVCRRLLGAENPSTARPTAAPVQIFSRWSGQMLQSGETRTNRCVKLTPARTAADAAMTLFWSRDLCWPMANRSVMTRRWWSNEVIWTLGLGVMKYTNKYIWLFSITHAVYSMN